MKVPFFTIGHSTRSLDELVELLKGAEVRLLADIRTVPKSRTNPQFNKDTLPGGLAASGISYEHMTALGGLRPKSRTVGPEVNAFWTNDAFHNYADYALSEEFHAGLGRLIEEGSRQRCAIMCSEAVWWRCHRRIVTDYLIAHHEEVFHIIGHGRLEAAKPTPGAVIRPEGRVSLAQTSKVPGMSSTPAGSWFAQIPILRALGQTPSEVVIRRPGDRVLSAPLPVAPYAQRHWQFAWMSLAAYAGTNAGANRIKQDAIEEAKHPGRTTPDGTPLAYRDPVPILEHAGSSRWLSFEPMSMWDRIENAHLRVEVWENQARGALAIAFGGTVFTDLRDWLSNLRWFIPWHEDEYTQVVRTFGPAFRDEYKRRFASSSRPVLFSTGHSLGGGLAQQFAYALPPDPDGIVPRVSEVYAFDPSPVTGYFSVERGLRDANSRDLSIDRIYERGEILALARSLLSLVEVPSARQPAIGGTRYSLFYRWNPIADHSMVQLAHKIDRAAQA